MTRPEPVPTAFEIDGPDPDGWRLAVRFCDLLIAMALMTFAAFVAVETRALHLIF